ncbi:MAG: GtrA family protein [Terracidiphilus sp.]
MKLVPNLSLRVSPLRHQARLFVLAGITTASLDYLLLFALVKFLNLNYLIAAAVSFLLASGVNYLLSVRWVFVSGRYGKSLELSVFIVTSLLGLAVNQLAMWLLVDQIHLDYRISKLFAIAAVTSWNFFSKKKLVFIN